MVPLLALLLAAPARADFACGEGARARPPVGVVVSTYPTVIEHGEPLARINALHPARDPKGPLSQGLTVAEYRLHYSADLKGACAEGCARACAWVGALTVDVTPVAVRIHIPVEYPAGSCEHGQLLNHEREHERLHRRRLRVLARDMRDALARAGSRAGPLGPVQAADRRAAFELLTERLESVLRPVYESHLRRMRQEDAALDTAREYRRLGRACRGWISG